jgi:hypothetical protein
MTSRKEHSSRGRLRCSVRVLLVFCAMYSVPAHTLIQCRAPRRHLSWLLSSSGGERALCARDASKGKGIAAGPHRTVRHHHPPGWFVGGTEEVESAYYGQSPLASGLRHARGNEVIERSHPTCTREACWHLG